VKFKVFKSNSNQQIDETSDSCLLKSISHSQSRSSFSASSELSADGDSKAQVIQTNKDKKANFIAQSPALSFRIPSSPQVEVGL
jgi:hypothetical protein